MNFYSAGLNLINFNANNFFCFDLSELMMILTQPMKALCGFIKYVYEDTLIDSIAIQQKLNSYVIHNFLIFHMQSKMFHL